LPAAEADVWVEAWLSRMALDACTGTHNTT
jgi:hypothetical protein